MEVITSYTCFSEINELKDFSEGLRVNYPKLDTKYIKKGEKKYFSETKYVYQKNSALYVNVNGLDYRTSVQSLLDLNLELIRYLNVNSVDSTIEIVVYEKDIVSLELGVDILKKLVSNNFELLVSVYHERLAIKEAVYTGREEVSLKTMEKLGIQHTRIDNSQE